VSAPKHPLVELAYSALVDLGRIPRFGENSTTSASALERAWVRAPLSVAIGGPVPARTELFNHLCGRKVLDPEARPITAAALRVRRGKVTRLQAIRDDGTTEEHVLPAEQEDDDGLRMRAAAAKGLVDERKLALTRVEKSLPVFARSRPRGLMIFLWPLWWLLTRRHRRALAERQFSEKAYDQACDAQARAASELETSASRIRIERGRFFESLRALSSGPSLGGTVREVVLELAESPLPAGVDLLELTRPLGPKAAADVDAVLLVERDQVFAPHTAEGDAPALGSVNEVVPTLPVLLGRARALVLAQRARDEIEPILRALDDDISDTEETFRVRIERLEAMQILDAAEFARAELDKVKPMVSQSIHAVIEHAAAHAGSELDRLGTEWSVAMAMTQNADQLKQAVGRIQDSAPVDAKRIADEVRSLANGGAAGAAHDIFPEMLAALRPLGLDEQRLSHAPQLAQIEVLPSLASASPAKLSGAAGWLTGLFRSFETKRTDVQDKADARIKHLREVAGAEILDAEPKLRAAIEQTLYAEMTAAIGRQVAWLDRTLGHEREAVAAEGLALAPLARMRDRLRHDLEQITLGIAQIEREAPALAAAARATATSSAG
jgi:hypothetical protein